MNKFILVILKVRSKLQHLYYRYVKYGLVPEPTRSFLTTFQLGLNARKQVDKVMYTILELNINRVTNLFANNFDLVEKIDGVLNELDHEYNEELDKLDANDTLLWKMVLTEFVRTHDDSVVVKVWGISSDDLEKVKAMMKK